MGVISNENSNESRSDHITGVVSNGNSNVSSHQELEGHKVATVGILNLLAEIKIVELFFFLCFALFFLYKKRSQYQGTERDKRVHTLQYKETGWEEKEKPQMEGQKDNVIKAAKYYL